MSFYPVIHNKPPPIYVYFHNFWNGFITKTDAIYIGRYRFSIEAGPENLSNEIAIRVDGISQVFNKIVKLHDTSLEIPKKSLVAILGPSGCGKSILLKALSPFTT